MRLFVKHADCTVVVALAEGATLTDLLNKCETKFGLTTSVTLQLDVNGTPTIEDIDEVRDGDTLLVVMQSTIDEDTGEKKNGSDQEQDEDSEEDGDEDNSERDEDEDEDSNEDEDSDEEEDSEREEDSEDSEDSDDDYVEHKPKKAKTSHSPSSAAPQSMEAVMDKNVVPPPASASGTTTADDEIRERIRNILKRGLHPNTPEAEAANSMRLAERMIRKHNVSRAEVMETAEDASVNGDMVKVHIRNPQTKKPSTTKHWFHDLARAMTHHFKCKYYFNVRMGQRCYFSFYGIASNVYAAAFAFETAFNRIMILMSQHTIPQGEYDRKRRTGEISVCRATYTKMARVSYCDGVAMGLLQRVREMTAKPEPTTAPEETEYHVTPEEETRLACVTKKVEESVLEKKGIKFSKGKGRTYTRTQRRPESYAAGKRDSSHIDLQQRTLA